MATTLKERDEVEYHKKDGIINSTAAAASAGAAAGVIIGAAAGPAGMAAGVVVGGIVGAVTGNIFAHDINSALEDTFWSENYKSRPYVESSEPYAKYKPMYHYGIDAYKSFSGREYHEIEPELKEGWAEKNHELSWDKAQHAVKDAYNKLYNGRRK
jgi:hypothetical protein